MIIFRIRGVLLEADAGTALQGLFVKAYDKDVLFDDLLGSATTDDGGRFEIVTELDDFRDLFERRPDLYFKVFRADRRTLVYNTEHGVRWNALHESEVEIRIPWERVHDPAQLRIELMGDGGAPRSEYETGESLRITAKGLRPLQAYDITVTAEGQDLFESRLLADARGRIEPTVLWPQMGLDDPSSERRFSLTEADRFWNGRELRVAIAARGKTVAESSLRFRLTSSHPQVIATDRDGRLLNAFESHEQSLYVALRALPFGGTARIYIVSRQHEWRPGDPLEVATLVSGEDAIVDVMLGEAFSETRLEILPARSLRPGAYDFIVRPLRYGVEENEARRLLRRDVVGSRFATGLVIRENFWQGKPVLGGCVNKLPMSGRAIAGAPYFRYADAFAVGEDVWAALDPGIVDPGNVGKMCAVYVIASKTDAQWNADNSLTHLAVLGGNGAVQKIKVQAGCINANKVKVWPAAMQPGEYDIVADFGNNVSDAINFVADNAYDTPLDVIDGYFLAGFRVLQDPGTMAEFAHAGNWNYDESVVAALGMSGTITVDDENRGYAVPGAFSVLSRSVALKAHVFFPADAAGVTDPAQISAAQADYPLIVIVHGNGHNYVSYDFLLTHLARNGFIAASIDNRFLSGGNPIHGMHGLGRANNFFAHLAVIQAKFAAKAQNNVGIMGHSRGGEAVVKIPRLNQQLALGHNINASLALAPTDQYGREQLGGAWGTPFFVLYGSRDGDISGVHPTVYGGAFTWRPTGFALYDRVSDATKNMLFVYKATHNGFITSNSDNGEAGLLTPTIQQAITLAYTNAFFRSRLRNESQWEGMFTGEWHPPSVASTGAECYAQFRRPAGRIVDNFEGGALNWQSSTIGGAVSHGATLPVDPTEGRLMDFPPGAPGLDTKSPHDSNGLKARWDQTGDRLTFAIPAGQNDVSGFSTLSLRLTQKEASASNPSNQPQDLRVALKDGANNERAIRISAFGALPYPDQRAQSDLRKSAFTTVRIPLASYTIVCAGQPKVDLQTVTELTLAFSIQPTGEIEVDEIEFTD